MKNLNWDKELKKVQRRGLYNPKVRMFSIIAIAVLTLGIGLTFSAFSYSSGDSQAFNSRVNKKVKVIISVTNGSGSVNTTTNYKSSGTVEYSVTPNSGYVLDEANTTCNYNSSTKKVIITPSSDTKCTVSFKQGPKLNEAILANNTVQTNVSWTTSSDKGLFMANGDKTLDGNPTYYFRGDVENNYVQFGTYQTNYLLGEAGDSNEMYAISASATYSQLVEECVYYTDYGYTSEDECIGDIKTNLDPAGEPITWRIVRINEDGTIRLILDHGMMNNMVYYLNEYGKTIYNPTFDVLDIEIEDWFEIHLITNTKIAEGSFCYHMDRKSDDFVNNPTFNCPSEYQQKKSIGLLTIDEALYAGVGYYTILGRINYLKGEWFWLSSRDNAIDKPYFWYVDSNGTSIYDIGENDYSTIRPVINLKADVTITSGDGTKDNPYVIN